MKKSNTYTILISFTILFGSIVFSGLLSQGYLSKIQNVVNNASIEKYVRPLINFGFMSESQFPIQHATVGLELDKFLIDEDKTPATGDEYYANVIDQCIFHSEESFDPGCIICRLKDAHGNVIGAGIVGESLNEPYIGSTQVRIDIEPDPQNPLSNEVQQVHNVQIDICGANEGCTPGYWRQDQHFGS